MKLVISCIEKTSRIFPKTDEYQAAQHEVTFEIADTGRTFIVDVGKDQYDFYTLYGKYTLTIEGIPNA